jgi:hypothetical protein
MKCMRIGEKRCNCSCFEIDQEMDAILLIIGIVYSLKKSSLNQYNNALISYFLRPEIMLRVRIPLRRGVLNTTLCDKVGQWLVAGLWFSPGYYSFLHQ